MFLRKYVAEDLEITKAREGFHIVLTFTLFPFLDFVFSYALVTVKRARD